MKNKPNSFDEAFALPIDKLLSLKDDVKIMSFKVPGGWTIAHYLARKKCPFSKGHFALKLETRSGWSVAHEQVSMGYVFDPKSIELKFTNSFGISVAHIQASKGYKFSSNSALCKLRSNKGITVKDVMNQYVIDNAPIIEEDNKESLVV